MSGPEERERAVELYFATPMTTAQVVEHPGYPTKRSLGRCLAKDSWYAGHMAKPVIPLETRRRAVELVPGGMRRKQAARQLGAGVGAVHDWVGACRGGRHDRAATQERERRAERQARGLPPPAVRRRR